MKLVKIIKNYKWDGYSLLRQTPGSTGVWGDVQFTEDDVASCDYVVVINHSLENTVIQCNPQNIWLMIQEPYRPQFFPWMTNFDSIYSKIFIPSDQVEGQNIFHTHTCLPWFDYDKVMSYDQLQGMDIPEKTKNVSIMATTKSAFPGHQKRIEFVRYLQKEQPVDVDFYGRGINPIENKWDALAPYRYSIAIENTSSPHYWTEKLADCFLAYTLPIYYGCTNLEKYFPPDSYVQINIENPEEASKVIKSVVAENSWEQRLSAITEARELILNKYQLFPFLAEHINNGGKDLGKQSNYLRGYKKEQMQSASSNLLLSVIVCTYNRAELLPNCLDSLLKQSFNSTQFEVIIVDNNSTDSTQLIAEDYARDNAGLHLVFEPEQGLSHARNTGLKVARGEFVAFIDDDARAPENWLELAARIIAEHSPDVFGGPVYPCDEEAPPNWYKKGYGVRGRMPQTGWLKRGHIAGTNIFFRKKLLQEYGGFDPLLGMKGDAVGYHEETVLVHRAIKEGKKVYYDDELTVEDRLPDYKFSLPYFLYSKYKVGFDGDSIWNADPLKCDPGLLAEKLEETMLKFDYALRKRDISRYEYPENYIVEEVAKEFVTIGLLVKQTREKQGSETRQASSSDCLHEQVHRLVKQYGVVALIKELIRSALSLLKKI